MESAETARCEECGEETIIQNPTVGAQYWCSIECLNKWLEIHSCIVEGIAKRGEQPSIVICDPFTGVWIPLKISKVTGG